MNPLRTSRGPRRTESQTWLGRGLQHMLGVMGVILALPTGLGAAVGVADPRRFGEGVGRFTLFCGLATLAISGLLQNGHRRSAGVAAGVLATVVTAAVIVVVIVGTR